MNKRKNIAILVPTLNKGGGERSAANLSVELAKDHNVWMLVHDGTDIVYPYGGTLVDLALPPARTLPGKVCTLLKRAAKVRRFKRKNRIDVTISHLPAANYVNVLSRWKDRIFCYVHSMEKRRTGTYLRENLITALSDKRICVSECVRKNMMVNFGFPERKTETVYNFCKAQGYPEKQEETEFCTIVNMGRLSQPKGQWHLIRAMKRVSAACPGARLVIYGEGEHRPMLEALVEKLELGAQIALAGFVNDPAEKLHQADLYVSSSLWEGLPMALIEAGQCGLPIISTDCDAGCREILAPDTPMEKKTAEIEEARYGILVPVCSEGSFHQTNLTPQEACLADAIILLLRDREKRRKYAALAKKRASDFCPEVIMEKWHRLLT